LSKLPLPFVKIPYGNIGVKGDTFISFDVPGAGSETSHFHFFDLLPKRFTPQDFGDGTHRFTDLPCRLTSLSRDKRSNTNKKENSSKGRTVVSKGYQTVAFELIF
jgi:hypothetical protein